MNIALNLTFLTLIYFTFIAGSAAAPASNRPEVNIADQIAIRSLVLSKSIGKVSGNTQ